MERKKKDKTGISSFILNFFHPTVLAIAAEFCSRNTHNEEEKERVEKT